jgi:putative CocE/NonD family hydrolase
VNVGSSTSPGRRVVIEHDVPARMRDGVVLRANIYRPSDDGAYPVLLSRQPYDKNTNINPVYADLVRLAAAGYLVVMQDVRGRYASDGDFEPGVHEFEDGYDTVQWAAKLPGSNGRVGTWGRSYHAETQWRAAVTGPPALHSMALGVSKFHYNVEAQERPGGTHEGSRLGWYQFQVGAEALRRRFLNNPARAAEEQRLLAETTAQLASGELFDLLPLRQLGDLPGSTMGEVIAAMDQPPDAPLSRRPWPADTYDLVQVDTFHIGGWYDIFLRGTLDQYQAMAAVAAPRKDQHRSQRRPPRLLVGPWTHSSFLSRQGEVDFGPDASGTDLGGTGGLNAEHLRWFDATLKGDDQGLVGVPPVRLFVMGENRWRGYDCYPVPAARIEDWHLHPSGGLRRDPAPASRPDRFQYDPADPVPTRGGSTMLPPRWPPGPADQREIEARPDVLSYTSAVLDAPYTVIGAVWVTLFAASSAADTDFVARLVDVHPDGRAINLADGIIRLSRHTSYSAPGRIEPQPAASVTPGKAYELCIDLQATAVTFLPGHRIRVDVTSSSHPRWIRHTNTVVNPLDATELVVASQQILHDPQHPSRIHLTVVPDDAS